MSVPPFFFNAILIQNNEFLTLVTFVVDLRNAAIRMATTF